MLKYIFLSVGLLIAGGAVKANIQNHSIGSKINLKAEELSESQKVERLIHYIKSMQNATFIRNGSEHSCKEAAEHLMSKWEKHKSKIRSADEFIEKLASKSGMSGEEYKIKFDNGTVLTTYQVLKKELRRLESE
jgi:hypothetical protein